MGSSRWVAIVLAEMQTAAPKVHPITAPANGLGIMAMTI